MPGSPNMEMFIEELITLCGAEHVVVAQSSDESHCTSGVRRDVPATVYPASKDDVVKILSLANRHVVPLHPVSTGRNWGYGGDSPVTDGAVILNLSRLTRILGYDPVLGVVTIEPGVTQGQLSQFLIEQGDKFACFVTGSSPECSLIGNALERGYGANPPTDHFSAVMSLTAVLPDGSVYQPLMAELGGGQSDRLYRWGVGPYLDGLFSQSGLGVVTSMTLMLSPQFEETAIVMFDPGADTSLSDLVEMIRAVRLKTSDCLISLKILNQLYLTALGGLHLDPSVPVSAEAYADLGRKNMIPAYKVIGMIGGTRGQVKATIKDIKRVMKSYKGRALVLTQSQTKLISRLISLPVVSSLVPASISDQLKLLGRSYDLIRGKPSEKMLELAYWKQGHVTNEAGLHPARDGCGLLWMPFIVPNKGVETETLHRVISDKIWAAGLEPLMGLTHLNQASSVMLYGLIYERETYQDKIKALHQEITELVRASGLMAYRLHVDEIAGLPKDNTAHEMMRVLKARFDPGNIVSRGRFD